MGETISLDDYTTLPGKSGATHSISLCIAKMDEDEINRLMQNALDQANARAEQKFEERLTALREEFNQKHHGSRLVL